MPKFLENLPIKKNGKPIIKIKTKVTKVIFHEIKRGTNKKIINFVEDEINLPVAARLSPNLSISLVNEFNNFPCFSELIYSHPALKIEL